MKIIKSAFLIALFNYFMVAAIVLAFKKPNEQITVPATTIAENIVATPTIVKEKTVVPTTTATTQQVPVVDNRCIVVIDGGKYDVTQFRNIHSGGDIFQCGTDMSAIFHGQHDNSYLNRMSQYKI